MTRSNAKGFKAFTRYLPLRMVKAFGLMCNPLFDQIVFVEFSPENFRKKLR